MMVTFRRCIQCSLKQVGISSPHIRINICRSLSTIPDEKVRITVPHKMVEKHRKAVLKSEVKKAQSKKKKYHGTEIISCKKKQFNHYQGQMYSDFKPENLASRGWKNRKSNGDYFTINAFTKNPSLTMKEDSFVPTFDKFNINPVIVDALKQYDIVKPTNVQAQAIPYLLRGRNALCCAETGSGKTLAYLIPIIERLVKYKEETGDTDSINRPFAVIMVPSRELADQTEAVARDLGAVVGFDSYSQCGGRRTQRLLKWKYKKPMDILVATPGVLTKALANRIYDMSRLSTIVIDEVDTLMDDSFNDLTLRILNKIMRACGTMAHLNHEEVDDEVDGEESDSEDDNTLETAGLQLVMTGATIPKGLKEIAGSIIPIDEMVHIKTNQLHKLLPHVSQKFVKVANQHKFEIILKHLKQNQTKNIPTIVFCNNSKTIDFLSITLEENNLETVKLHAQIPSELREYKFERFQQGHCDILLATDLGSRGLNTVRVEHVVNFDFPHFMSDYIHRVGRVGRVGSRGSSFVLNLISRKWDVDLVWAIETSARRVTELHNVNANIKKKLSKIIEEKFGSNTSVPETEETE